MLTYITIAAGIASIISAAAALIAVIFQIREQRKNEKEKRELAKARFSIIGGFISGKKLSINIHNGGNKYIYNIDPKWSLNNKVNYTVSRAIDNRAPYEYVVELEFEDNDTANLDGDIIVNYNTIYGKLESMKKKILIQNAEFKEFKGDFIENI
ncbi:hypothetical protein [Clostridium sp. C2-6-12]|uniref:hypothetical protein n=1 Tax=Clostridium sp. C2-6-12 TaxID=2698832 RepID=UPI001371FA04|nr:hypothetical protein [Clostridium sp. C2-6-12]